MHNSTINVMFCALDRNVSDAWRRYFDDVHFGINHMTIRCLFSELIPTGAILLFNCYILYHLVQTYRPLTPLTSDRLRRKYSRTTSWMTIVLLLHSSLFLSSLFLHIVGHVMTVEAHETWWVSMAVLVNCSLNFYLYCLSGKAFRNEIHRFIQQLKERLSRGSQSQQIPSDPNQRLLHELNPVPDIL